MYQLGTTKYHLSCNKLGYIPHLLLHTAHLLLLIIKLYNYSGKIMDGHVVKVGLNEKKQNWKEFENLKMMKFS